jgi:hypothetical protein
MHILIEGQCYLVEDLKKIFNDQPIPTFYNQKGNSAIINTVGYYYSIDKKEIVYMLPKVFMSAEELKDDENDEEIICQWEKKFTIFKKPDNIQFLNLKELFYIDSLEGSIKHDSKYEWIRHITISFYNSLQEFKRRKWNSDIINIGDVNELNTNIGEDEYSYLDIVLSFANFYKKNISIIVFRQIEQISNQPKKPKWEKTIRRTLPIIDKNNSPIYLDVRNKKSINNTEEQLLIYFFSILNHFKEKNYFNISINKNYKLIKGDAFKNLLLNDVGLIKLRKIKYKYFSDTMKRMYKLCELFFDPLDKGSVKKRNQEFISFKKYNIVFEDMIDKLLTEENSLDVFDKKTTKDQINIKKLKNNDDGKIIDHLFEYKGLIEYKDIIDTSNIFYIGDSKYYRPGKLADNLSVYKQYTYAKNIIQFNINLFNDNDKKKYASNEMRYRDEVTEGYNITPNFLIYGNIEKHEDFNNINLTLLDNIKHSFHWKERLFDRDSLFICQYSINYLFVLNAYTEKSEISLMIYRKEIKEKLRNNFIDFFENEKESEFKFYKLDLPNLKEFVDINFKILNGRCISLSDKKLLVVLHKSDISTKGKKGPLVELLINNKIDLSENSKDIFKFNTNKEIDYSISMNDNINLNMAADSKAKYRG